MRQDADTSLRQELRISNTAATPKTLHLEPWGEQFAMAPAESIDLIANGPRGHHLTAEIGESDIVVWGWAGSTIVIFRDGMEVESGAATIPCPTALPKSTKGP